MRTPNGLLAAAMLASLALPHPAIGCTTGVVSGRVTADGRPLLWKNRDAPAKDNRVVFVSGNGHAFLAVVNAGSSGTGSVWMGVNEKGFCIENSVIKDMPRNDKPGLGNGEFMRHALATCANVKEFEALLTKTNETGRKTLANYGVIDAEGGAAIFETGHNTFVKFDANDPATAPLGYVVRSNFSFTGTGNSKLEDGGDLSDVYSGDRYLRADALFRKAAEAKTLDHTYILRHCTRDLADGKGCPHPGSVNGAAGPLPQEIDTAATLSRKSTVSVGVFHGVRPGEDPTLTTLWVMLGEPAVSIAVPCWVKAGEAAAPLSAGKRSELCTTAVTLRNGLYDKSGTKLRTAALPRVWESTLAAEDANLREASKSLEAWRTKAPRTEDVAELHRSAATRALETLTRLKADVVTPEPAPVVPGDVKK